MAKKNKFKNYTALKVGNKVKKGDQIYDPHTRGWYNADGYNIGGRLLDFERARRPLKYRLLQAGEIIQKGDIWKFTGQYQHKVNSWSIGQPLWENNVGFCRRPLKK